MTCASPSLFDTLYYFLQQAVSALLDLDQCASLKSSLRPLSHSLIKQGLLRHKDKDVRLLVSVCLCEIIRILAPKPPFNDKAFKVSILVFYLMSLSCYLLTILNLHVGHF